MIDTEIGKRSLPDKKQHQLVSKLASQKIILGEKKHEQLWWNNLKED